MIDTSLQAQKQEQLGRLAIALAHDFGNVLQAIIGGAVEMRGGPLPAPAERGLDEILDAADRAREMVASLIALARPDMAALDPAWVDASIRRLEPVLRRLLRDRVVALRLHLGAPGGRVRISAGQLQQLVLNLAVNGRDAMPGGGELIVSTELVGDRIRLIVSDEGQGIPPELQERVFEPYFTTKPVGRGTGLGLATVREIAQNAGGLVRLLSAPGRGTSFIVELPAL